MIHIYWGPPREGKTYLCTQRSVVNMLKGKKVYSNYPIIYRHKEKIFSSRIWSDDMIYENITNCDIIIDEAYRSYSSRNYQKFTTDQHTFFATNGHNRLEIYLIAQNPARIDVIIREICNYFHFVHKFTIPWFWKDPEGNYSRPLYFCDWVFICEDDMMSRSNDRVYLKNRTLFSKKYASAYDTHFYASRNQKPEPNETWYDKFSEEIEDTIG